MNNKVLMSTIFSFFCIILSNEDCLPWGIKTHKILSEHSVKNSILNQKDFLKGLGFDKGLIHKLQWNNKNWSVLDWIKYGSEREDSYIILDYLPIW
ncbi:MAG: hypothetical protein QXH17_08675, partial [Candidatus Bathyarchaeia archaeon]